MPRTSSSRESKDRPWRTLPAERANILKMFHAAQEHERGTTHLSREALGDIARYLGLSIAEVEGVASFYRYFSTGPRGRHVIRICDSLSCRICGSLQLYQAIRSHIGIGNGETTADGEFTLEVVNCLGSCDTAPNVMVDGELHPRVKPDDIAGLLDSVRRSEEEAS